MKNIKGVLLTLILIVILVVVSIYLWHTKNETRALSFADDSTWTTYRASPFNFSFDYPIDGFVTDIPDMSNRILRVQNYDPETFSRSFNGKYWVEFFVFITNNEPSSCPQRLVVHSVVSLDGVAMNKGRSKADEESGLGGLQAVCIDRGDYDLYAQGQDGTEEDVVNQIFDRIRFSY